MRPQFDLDKIKFATDRPTFERAVVIYESGGVINFKEDGYGFEARVRGSGDNVYNIYVSGKRYDRGMCTCYLGQEDALCKHMVAVAIRAVTGGKELKEEDKDVVAGPKCSGRLGELKKEELAEVKAEITVAMRYIKPYNGPSRIWFAYQDSLMEGCNRLAAIVSNLPVGKQAAELLVSLLLRLDKKLCTGGVDDSNGTVGGFMEEAVVVLEDFARLDPRCINAFNKLVDRETCFGWEDPLIKLLDGEKI